MVDIGVCQKVRVGLTRDLFWGKNILLLNKCFSNCILPIDLRNFRKFSYTKCFIFILGDVAKCFRGAS